MSAYTFESVDQAIAAYNGQWGPEIAKAAEEVLDEHGLLVDEPDDDPDGPDEHDEAWAREATTQVARLEQELGRPLSMREVDTLVDDHGASDQMPDFKASYDEVIGRTSRNKEDWIAVGTEIYEEAEAEKAGEYGSEPSLEGSE